MSSPAKVERFDFVILWILYHEIRVSGLIFGKFERVDERTSQTDS
ncbi:predicted protein [Sclerotinia sclerotiorum 1980 UF-70]|uniref:Uncharacterized protein n=1 Tax=Sclerotinia sclerotiorum (strain ATCC 18683 / 1980 / Ss-1) TaxID=665079 RepID=A7EU68_SCLS1|nr:predicted protein [Sclerotinia sclerotiorum 1980 UF-70]EDN93010.1 predicted protein [Sclerotinia sclerotiorum 1980 UF-70]